jgi:hypothetical protein
MTTTTQNITDLVMKLQQLDAALGDARDVLNTPRAQEAFHGKKQELSRTISGLRNPSLDKPLALLADVEARRAAVLTKEADITQQRADALDPATIRDARERDKALDRQRYLNQSLQRLRDGTLLYAPGMAYERLSDLDARIAELTERRDRAQRVLDGHMQAAQALLAETVAG